MEKSRSIIIGGPRQKALREIEETQRSDDSRLKQGTVRGQTSALNYNPGAYTKGDNSPGKGSVLLRIGEGGQKP